MPETVCSKCRESVSEDASACPHCGYDPAAPHQKWGKIDGVLGGLLIMSVIGSPVGLFVLWRAWRHGRAAKKATVGVPA